MIFLSKDGQDEYINMFARGCGQASVNTEDFVYKDSNEPIVLRGILKKKWIQQCWKDGRDFYYLDTGYFGNEITKTNPNGWKIWHRIVKNDLQHNSIILRPGNRFQKFNKQFSPWKTSGKKILIAAPDEKPCKFYGIDKDQWIQQTVDTIKQYTNRPIEVRERAAKRIDRVVNDTLQTALDRDVFALVTFNSVAAVESVFHGIPVFTLAPVNAASPVGLQDLSQIENPYYPTTEKLQEWAYHLSYGQFHTNELKTGRAMKILMS